VSSPTRWRTVAEKSSLPEFPTGELNTADAVDLITASLYAVTGTARRIHDDVDAEDPTTADILHAIIERLEQLAWMIDAENRVANASLPRPIHR
jgi:starvation-inducible DNA-binding protein